MRAADRGPAARGLLSAAAEADISLCRDGGAYVACGQKSAVAGGRCRGASQREHGSKALRRIRGCFYFSCGGAVSLHINFTFLLFEQFVQLTLEASEDAPPDGNGTWNTVAWHASKTLTPH